jgi:hypothetical protein
MSIVFKKTRYHAGITLAGCARVGPGREKLEEEEKILARRVALARWASYSTSPEPGRQDN